MIVSQDVGYCTKYNADTGRILRFTPAVTYEVTDRQKPISILRLRRVYDKKPDNYWFESQGRINEYVKIKVTVEILDDEADKSNINANEQKGLQ